MVGFKIVSRGAGGNNITHSPSHTPARTPSKPRPNHFPIPPVDSVPRSPSNSSPADPDPFARTVQGQSASIYDRFVSQPSQPLPSAQGKGPAAARVVSSASTFEERYHVEKPVIIDKDNDKTPKTSSTPFPRQSEKHHIPSYASSYADVSSAAASQEDLNKNSSVEDIPSIVVFPVDKRSSTKMRPSPLNPAATPEQSGYETGSSAPDTMPRRYRLRSQRSHGILEEMPEINEPVHHVSSNMPSYTPGVLASLGMGFGNNQSSISVASKAKADKVLGLDPHAKLASFYLVSGLPREYPDWCLADSEATQGMHPAENSLGVYWRPDVLGSAFSGQKTEDWMKEMARQRKESKSGSAYGRSVKGVHVPDAGPDGPQKLVTKTIKYAHPRDVEIVNSTLPPATTCHSFTFTIPKHDTLANIARTRLDSSLTPNSNMSTAPSYADTSVLANPEEAQLAVPQLNVRNMSSATELAFHGVTLTVWTHADAERVVALKQLKAQREKLKNSGMATYRSNPAMKLSKASTERTSSRRRSSTPWGKSKVTGGGEITASETEAAMSDSDLDLPRRALRSRTSVVESLPEDMAVVFDSPGDAYWMPYSITLVSRHPIYDVMQDYLRLSWSRYKGNAQGHMTQICRLLNHDTPRPGEVYRLQISYKGDDTVSVEGVMPGALDFERGLVKVDFQLWPMFQALDIDHILTCVEVSLSNSGRIIFCSKNPAMLNLCVSTLKYIVELRGWDGIAMPMIHARDMTFVIEDPGPYIIGMPTECRYMISIPSEVVIVDIDLNSLSCKCPPLGVISPRQRREKSKQRLLAAFASGYPHEKSIPLEFRVPFPNGTFRNFNKFLHGLEKPPYLGERVRAPNWWRHVEVITAFDKIMLDKHKKPSLIQRLTKSGMARQQAQLTVGEQLARTMMRRRALHYVETRDDSEVKVAKINRRLQKLIQEGNEWKEQWKKFERYALELTQQAEEMRNKIEREKREAKRLSSVAAEQSKANVELEEKLKATEDARSEAMRQLSDMHQNLQELEKEREEIMNVFESQINDALEGMPGMADDEDISRPTTPTDSLRSSLASETQTFSRLRPVTRDSTNSAFSRFTAESSVSILGAAKGKGRTSSFRVRMGGGGGGGRPGTANTLWRDNEDRMESIQAKMAALQVEVRRNRASMMAKPTLERSASNTNSNEDDDKDQDGPPTPTNQSPTPNAHDAPDTPVGTIDKEKAYVPAVVQSTEVVIATISMDEKIDMRAAVDSAE